jgi:hypothetical protein
MKAQGIGKIKITEELTLVNPTMEVRNVTYSWSGDDKIYFEFIFIEKNSSLKHSRTFEIINEKGSYLSGEDIWNKLLEIPFIKDFDILENRNWIKRFINYLTK